MSRRTFPPTPVLPDGTPDDVEAAFYEGLRHGNVEQVMGCWADEDDIACVHPGGERLHGALAIRASLEAMFADGGSIPVQVAHIRRIDSAASAVHHVLEQVEVLTAQGLAQGYVLATNVYLKTPLGWRLVVHHASPGPAPATLEPHAPPKMLH